MDHGVLLTKLAGMGITMSFWKWTQSYLSGRTQQVKLPGVLSRHGEVIAGVPQGGVISPTLFNVHVNDIEDCIPRGIPVSTCKYADDCTLYELVFKDSVSQMQDAVTYLERWAVQNKMELSFHLFHFILFLFKHGQFISLKIHITYTRICKTQTIYYNTKSCFP